VDCNFFPVEHVCTVQLQDIQRMRVFPYAPFFFAKPLKMLLTQADDYGTIASSTLMKGMIMPDLGFDLDELEKLLTKNLKVLKEAKEKNLPLEWSATENREDLGWIDCNMTICPEHLWNMKFRTKRKNYAILYKDGSINGPYESAEEAERNNIVGGMVVKLVPANVPLHPPF